jgi:hypothetical protein
MKNEMIETIEKHGIDFTSEMLSEYINLKIPSEDVAIQFILEELEAASQGNATAKLFASTSGFDEDDYKGAMLNSFEEVDGDNGPQQEILNLCMMLYTNQNLMTELRIKTVDNIMKAWKLGKYSALNNKVRLINIVAQVNDSDDGIFANINNDLNESITQNNDVMILMSYGYARRTAAAGLYLQGVFSRENYMQASKTFKSLQLQTGLSVEFQEEASSQSIELLLSYSPRLIKTMISKITSVVELDQVYCAYDKNIDYSFDQVLDFFVDNNNPQTDVGEAKDYEYETGELDIEQTFFSFDDEFYEDDSPNYQIPDIDDEKIPF